jgi:hypothetical protein
MPPYPRLPPATFTPLCAARHPAALSDQAMTRRRAPALLPAAAPAPTQRPAHRKSRPQPARLTVAPEPSNPLARQPLGSQPHTSPRPAHDQRGGFEHRPGRARGLRRVQSRARRHRRRRRAHPCAAAVSHPGRPRPPGAPCAVCARARASEGPDFCSGRVPAPGRGCPAPRWHAARSLLRAPRAASAQRHRPARPAVAQEWAQEPDHDPRPQEELRLQEGPQGGLRAPRRASAGTQPRLRCSDDALAGASPSLPPIAPRRAPSIEAAHSPRPRARRRSAVPARPCGRGRIPCGAPAARLLPSSRAAPRRRPNSPGPQEGVLLQRQRRG